MSTTAQPPAGASISAASGEKSFFEQQREVLLKEIGLSFEHVLQNINKLNRSLEGVIAVGNEFSSVEALWSQFEGVMVKDPDAEAEAHNGEEERHEDGEESRLEEDRGTGR